MGPDLLLGALRARSLAIGLLLVACFGGLGCSLIGRSQPPPVRYYPIPLAEVEAAEPAADAPAIRLVEPTAPDLYRRPWVARGTDGGRSQRSDVAWQRLPSDVLESAIRRQLFDRGRARSSTAAGAAVLRVELHDLSIGTGAEPELVVHLRWSLRDPAGRELGGGPLSERVPAASARPEDVAAAAAQAITALAGSIAAGALAAAAD